MAALIGLGMIAVLLALSAGLVGLALWMVWRLMRPSVRGEPISRRAKAGAISLVVIAAGMIVSSYVAVEMWDREAVLARVPAPLEVAAVEYRLERAPGFGLPGDNETGVLVYRLNDESTRWVRGQGAAIGRVPPGRGWQATPIVAEAGHPWHPYDDESGTGPTSPHPPNLMEYLDQYGFGIPVAVERAAEIDRAIQSPGSYYRYGRGGTVTIIDPARGKVYFAYAG